MARDGVSPELLSHGTNLLSPGTTASEKAQQPDLVILDLHARPGLLFHVNRIKPGLLS